MNTILPLSFPPREQHVLKPASTDLDIETFEPTPQLAFAVLAASLVPTPHHVQSYKNSVRKLLWPFVENGALDFENRAFAVYAIAVLCQEPIPYYWPKTVAVVVAALEGY